MKKIKNIVTKGTLLYALLLIIAGIGAYLIFRPTINKAAFEPVNKTQYQGKTVADYFVEHLRMTPDEAKKAEEKGVSFYVTDNMTLDALVSNLHYYGLVKDEEAFRYALEHSDDTHPATSPKALKIGKNDIDRGFYGFSTTMSAWEIAQILVNYPQAIKEDYGYMFMPGAPMKDAPQVRPEK